MTLRYDHLTGGPAGRKVHYLARRYLKLGWDDWDALPWWQQRAYVEGLVEELSDPDENEPSEIDAADMGFSTG